MKRILNPENGAKISTQFVALGKEKRDEEGNITNAKKISIGVGQSFVATDEEFEFLMKTFGFLQNGGATEELPAEPVVAKKELEEIKLDGAELPVTPHGIFNDKIDFRAVKGAITGVNCIFKIGLFERVLECGFSLVPEFFASHCLFWPG